MQGTTIQREGISQEDSTRESPFTSPYHCELTENTLAVESMRTSVSAPVPLTPWRTKYRPYLSSSPRPRFRKHHQGLPQTHRLRLQCPRLLRQSSIVGRTSTTQTYMHKPFFHISLD